MASGKSNYAIVLLDDSHRVYRVCTNLSKSVAKAYKRAFKASNGQLRAVIRKGDQV